MILNEILAHKRSEVAERKMAKSLADIEREALLVVGPSGRFYSALAPPGVSLIAEIKRASPSKGLITESFDPGALARAYERGGASAISCLTDERFFRGCTEYLIAARGEVSLPFLRKDFTVDRYQIAEAVVMGASAVLLIVAALAQAEIVDLLKYATDLGLDVLVEAHDLPEAVRAVEAGATILGINNRDLHDFTVDLHTTEAVVSALAHRPGVIVSESGIGGPEDIDYLRGVGVQAALVGEILMRAADAESLARAMVEAGRPV